MKWKRACCVFVYLRSNEIFSALRPIQGEHSLWSVVQLLHTQNSFLLSLAGLLPPIPRNSPLRQPSQTHELSSAHKFWLNKSPESRKLYDRLIRWHWSFLQHGKGDCFSITYRDVLCEQRSTVTQKPHTKQFNWWNLIFKWEHALIILIRDTQSFTF